MGEGERGLQGQGGGAVLHEGRGVPCQGAGNDAQFYQGAKSTFASWCRVVSGGAYQLERAFVLQLREVRRTPFCGHLLALCYPNHLDPVHKFSQSRLQTCIVIAFLYSKVKSMS